MYVQRIHASVIYSLNKNKKIVYSCVIFVIFEMYRVNSTTLVSRTVDEIKKKWADKQSLTKKKEGERRRSMSKTGGGPVPEFYFKEYLFIITCC